METNIIPFAQAEQVLPLEKREVHQLLLAIRRLARTVCRQIDRLAESNRVDRRQANKHRATGNPFLIRSAEALDARIAERRGTIHSWNKTLISLGSHARALEEDIDRLIPLNELFDLLEVNPVDRAKVGPTDGFKEIVFIHGLEDSATHRGSDWKEGPLFRALSCYMMDAIRNNP